METDHGIKGFLETSFLDWPGRLAAVLFLGGCNFRCPFCHNAELVLAPHGIPSSPSARSSAGSARSAGGSTASW